jgi:hypothetical protein
MECRLTGETEVLGENLPQRHICPSQNPTWPDPGLNPGRRGGKPATNRLSYGAAVDSLYRGTLSFSDFAVKIDLLLLHWSCFNQQKIWFSLGQPYVISLKPSLISFVKEAILNWRVRWSVQNWYWHLLCFTCLADPSVIPIPLQVFTYRARSCNLHVINPILMNVEDRGANDLKGKKYSVSKWSKYLQRVEKWMSRKRMWFPTLKDGGRFSCSEPMNSYASGCVNFW